MSLKFCCIALLVFVLPVFNVGAQAVIRINQLGYTPGGLKMAVWGSKQKDTLTHFRLMDAVTDQVVFKATARAAYGKYGPFQQTYQLHFSEYKKAGKYYLLAGNSRSPVFSIGDEVYRGAADFCLRYMRQQRSGFNPVLADSCHTHDGYTLGGPMPDSSFVPVTGGWHDASDYLQYVTTSANATYQLLAAWRDFPRVFGDEYAGNGLVGRNGLADIADEARWGLNWLVKMHPSKTLMFHQLGDDRDHISMRRPGLDSQYGKGFQRPVYFVSGQPQGSERFKNRSNGAANIAGKFSTAFSLGQQLFARRDIGFAEQLKERALNAYDWGLANPGVCQTAPNRAPYFYEEDNWTDDMELASSLLFRATGNNLYAKKAMEFGAMEPITPWMGADTARHYQWYPFANAGHYEMAAALPESRPERKAFIGWMRDGLQKIEAKARQNAFLRGIPFIWCSNNLTVAAANQAYWYRTHSGDTAFAMLEQANFDWLFGLNPWGTSMVYGLPQKGDTPEDPHSWFTHGGAMPVDGGLVDGPVYTSIYSNLIGISLTKPDAYAEWQSDLAVYHDDYGDYSTNEPTMDGTASLIYLLAAKESEAILQKPNGPQVAQGAIIRGDSSVPKITLVFTGHEYNDGLKFITQTLSREKIKAGFFATGLFAEKNSRQLAALRLAGHYVGPHSYDHLLYADWTKRDSLLVSKEFFMNDLQKNYGVLAPAGLPVEKAPIFLPPYEWYNDSIAAWSASMGITLINYTPGTLSTADYTTPDMPNYRNADTIYQSIMKLARAIPYGLNGYILLMHLGTDPARPDKFYQLLPLLIQQLKTEGYTFIRVDEMIGKPLAAEKKTAPRKRLRRR